jgi:broad specificity phosphatase PhoE
VRAQPDHTLFDARNQSKRQTGQPSAMPPTTVFLARHGQSEWNNQSRITGQADIGLSPKGVEQGLALAQCLKHEALHAIYASSLRRTADTAQATAQDKGMPIVSLPALNEIHMGTLQGRHRDDRDPEAQALWAQWQADVWGPAVAGGERFDDFAQRVGQALQSLLAQHAGQRILIVGHRATNRVLLGLLLAWPRQRWEELRLRNKYFYRVQCGDLAAISTYTLSGDKTGTCTEGLVM